MQPWKNLALVCGGAALLALGGCGGPAPTEPAKTSLLICLDGGTWNSLTPLLQAGELPNILRMMQEGAYGPLRSDPPFSPPSWTSLATGLTPEHHGIDNFVRRDEIDAESGAYRLLPIRSVDVEVPRIWQMVAASGAAVAVERWLFTYPVQPVNGVVVSDYQGVAADYLHGAPLEQELKQNFRRRLYITPGARITREPTLAHDPARSAERFRERDRKLDRAVQDVDAAEQAYDYILEHYPEVAFCTVSFFWGNQMQHEFLHYWLAPEKYGADAAEAARYGQVIPDLYRTLDAFIGRVRADPRIERVMIVSDHGMQPIPMDLLTSIKAYHFQILWGTILADLGYADLVEPVAYRRTETGFIVKAEGAERQQLRQRFVRDLEALRFADDGTPLFAELRPPPGERWPDLVIGRYAPVRYGEIPQLFNRPVVGAPNRPEAVPAGRYLRFAGGYIRSEHGYDLNPDVPLGEDGILLVAAPEVRPGRRLEAGLARTIDVTPTMLHLLGLPVAADMDGRVLESILRPELLQTRPITQVPTYRGVAADPDAAAAAAAQPGDDEEYDRQTLERLRSLGYVN
jgi:hypothetical protein